MYELNLPKPSTELLNYLTEFSLNFPVEETNVLRKQKFEACNANLNIALSSHPYGTELRTSIKKEFEQYFLYDKDKFHIHCLLMQNVGVSSTCFVPPHTDIMRTIACNYTILPGGSNVTTTFYKRNSDNPAGTTASYNDFEVENSYSLNDDNWYLFNARQYHSVDNIENKRLVISLSLFDSSLSDFTTKYNNLIRRKI